MATVSDAAFTSDPGATMPPGYKAKVGCLETFQLPERVTGSAGDRTMGKALIEAWKRDGSEYLPGYAIFSRYSDCCASDL